jgi:outer membrane lipoprotein-sorting protein
MKKVGTVKNEQGVAHLVLIVLVVVVLAAIGGAAWRVSSSKKNDKKPATAANSQTAKVAADSEVETACLKEVNDKNLCKFAASYKIDGVAFRAVIDSTSDMGKSVMTMEVDGKNNSSVTTTQDGKEQAAFVTLNNTSYVKDADGSAWTKYPPAESVPGAGNPIGDIKVDSKNITEGNTISYKPLGKEACGKLTCYKYQVVDSKNPTQTQFLWFDTKDYQMQRFSFKDPQGETDMTFEYKSVTIKEPSPVHDLSIN